MSDKGDAYKYLDNKCTELGYESLGDFIGCQTTDTIATCMVVWFAEKQANGVARDNSGLYLQRVSNNEVAVCSCKKIPDQINIGGVMKCIHCNKPIKQTDC